MQTPFPPSNDENALVPSGKAAGRDSPTDLARPVEQADVPEAHPTFWTTVRLALAGRWRAVVMAGLITAAAGAWVGWWAGQPMYLSEGLVRIAYAAPPVLRGKEQEAIPVEIYHALLQSQQAMISSRPRIEAALHDPAWVATGRGASPATVERFASNLKVEHKTGADYLRITFTDPDAGVAGAAVQSVIGEFARSFRGHDEEFERSRLYALADRQRTLAERLADLRKQAAAVSGGVGVEDAKNLHEAAVREVARLEAVLSDIRLAAALAPGAGPTTMPAAAIDPQQIAATDPTMRGYLAERDRVRDELMQLRLNGYGENHPALTRRVAALAVITGRIAEYAVQYRGAPAVPASVRGLGGPAGGTPESLTARWGQSLESLRAEEASVGALCEAAKKEMVVRGLKRSDTLRLVAESDAVDKDLGEVTRRMDDLKLESSAGGRLNVVSAGETPITPSSDRRAPAAVLGGLLGGCLPAGLVVLREVGGTRYRRFGRAETEWREHARLLGVLPTLPDWSNGNAAESADAAHCLHHIRVALQVAKPRDRGATYLLSSATSGEGKTSVAAALGLAFAASGSRTLLIDCDLVSGRLTRGFGLQQAPGVRESLADGAARGRVVEAGRKNLWLLPAGLGDGSDGSDGSKGMSPSAADRLLAESAEGFDVVLVDSGPILGSIEASAVAGRVDGVILVLARDQQRSMVERAVRQLRAVRARIEGMIFNRAEAGDFQRSAYSYNYSSRQTGNKAALPPASVPVRMAPAPRLGPLVSSVAACPPEPAAGDRFQV